VLIKFKRSTLNPKRWTFWAIKNGAKENITPNSIDLKVQNVVIIPKVRATSLIRFTIKAFMADLFAWILVNQKLIRRYEQSPTPSHPKNS
jgi:hypothetical protein